jgi:hypothetical protein
MYRIKLTHSDNAISFTRTQFDHQTADRLARVCTNDPAIKAAVAVPVATCDCRCEEEHQLLCLNPYDRAA